MIILTSNTNNELYISASRYKTLNDPTYLFAFYHKQSANTYYVIPHKKPSTETYRERFDTFYINIDSSIPESLTGNTTSGSTNVHLIEGDYWLSIYEQFSTSNLNPLYSYDRCVEEYARVNVITTDTPTYSNDNYKYKIYNKD